RTPAAAIGARFRWGSIRSCAHDRRSSTSDARPSPSASAIWACAVARVPTTSARSPRASAGTRRPAATALTYPSTRSSAPTKRFAGSRPTTRTRPEAGVKYSALALLRGALSAHRNWVPAWRSPEPKSTYDVVIVGGGGHGLATAYYLAANHGINKVAVLERSYIGSGNVGRNTTLVRSNYQIDGNTQFFEFSLKLWEGLSHALNFNVMLSQRGQIVLAHGPAQLDVQARKGNIMRLNGIDAELLDRGEVMKILPYLDYSPDARFPIYGGLLQRRAGTVRHDAVAWGYARAADRLGVDIIENCEVTGFVIESGRALGVETTRGRILAEKTAIVVAG